ncbi:quinolinate synthase NadA [Anaerosacchariphilus polymeriproducens]|nr:quinolinate synthase NadA [Anaerosacchariphilus polymeriproducens]
MQKDFATMPRKELINFIQKRKEELGDKVTILAHNFTADDLIPFADVVGDSSKLTNATMESKTKYLLFTAARFFTEAACILVPEKTIIQANMQANCPLTYTIDENATRAAFAEIKKKCKSREPLPMGYFTASYQLKSFCGENDGTVCTASNSIKLIEYYLERNKAIFFTPMNNIAFNAIKALKIPDSDVFILDENTPLDSIPGDKKMYVWNVGCYVHSAFTKEDIDRVKEQYKDKGIKTISHLECLPEVIEECDYSSFTDGMHDLIKDSPAGSYWGIATTNNYIVRMANTYEDKNIIAIRPDLVCKDMVVTDLHHVAESLQSIIDYENGVGELKYQLKVPTKYRINAKKAIETMFEVNSIMNVVDEVVNF